MVSDRAYAVGHHKKAEESAKATGRETTLVAVRDADDGNDEDHGRRRAATENWLIGQGVPHFIVGYSARRDIFTRAALPLSLIFILELLNGINTESFDWIHNVAAAAAGVAIGVGIFALINTLRGRPAFRRPDSIGAIELGVFVLVPPIVPLLFDQPRQALVTLGANLVLLGAVYLITSYGLPAIVVWALRQAGAQLRNITNLMARSLPLLLLFTMFMFLNAEVWKVTDDIPQAFFAAVLALLVVVGSAFVLLRMPTELADLGAFDSWDAARADAADTPVLELVGAPGDDTAVAGASMVLVEPPEVADLDRRERLNVTFVLFFTQAVQILIVTTLIFVFYVVFGLFSVIPTTIEQWTGSTDLETILELPALGGEIVLTWELVRTALFIAAVAGLQFTVAALTDESYRTTFYERITDRIRVTLAVRALYRAVVDRDASAPVAG